MALVSIEQWRAERGIIGGATVMGGPTPPAAPPPDLSITSLQETIAYQADLIVRLQAALRGYVEKEQQAKVQAIAASITPKAGRVIRRKKLAKGEGTPGVISPSSGSPPPPPVPPRPKAA